MRSSGRLHDWNDARGFGFVTPDGGGARAFVHVRAFGRATRRPVDGDRLTYAVAVDARGRRNAVEVRFADAPASTADAFAHRTARPFRATGAATAFAVALAGAAVAGIVPWAVVGGYALASGACYLAYVADKAAAQRGRRRTPESTLHALALLGGWPGAAFAQQHVAHKRGKPAFVAIYRLTVALNLAALAAALLAQR